MIVPISIVQKHIVLFNIIWFVHMYQIHWGLRLIPQYFPGSKIKFINFKINFLYFSFLLGNHFYYLFNTPFTCKHYIMYLYDTLNQIQKHRFWSVKILWFYHEPSCSTWTGRDYLLSIIIIIWLYNSFIKLRGNNILSCMCLRVILSGL